MFDCNTKELKKEIDDLTKTVESLEKQLNQETVKKFSWTLVTQTTVEV